VLVGVATEVSQVEPHVLVPTEAPRVVGLEHLRVPKRSQRALPPPGTDLVHPLVAAGEEALEFLVGERAHVRAALELREVFDGVPLVADLDRVVAEALCALLDPPVSAVGHELHEKLQRVLVRADRRVGAGFLCRQQRGRPVLDVRGLPLPGIAPSEPLEAPQQADPSVDRVRRQHSALLLPAPALEHGIKDRRAGVEVNDVRGQDGMGSARQINPWQRQDPWFTVL
jgi:hypothetical protein